METEDKLWLPPLSPKDQKRLRRLLQKKGIIGFIWKGIKGFIKWTGFPGKTLWDWLQVLSVLAIPLVVAGATIYFTQQQTQLSDATNKEQHKTDIQIATDQQREATLETYFDRISDLLVNEQLYQSKPGDGVRDVARARTLIALRRLDGTRKGLLLQFLYEGHLITTPNSTLDHNNPIISLVGADLSGAILSGPPANRGQAKCQSIFTQSGVNLRDADLSGAFLSKAQLDCADLNGANLRGADLSEASLFGVTWIGASLIGTELDDALLDDSNLRNTNLSGASLLHASLITSNLKDANLKGALLIGTVLEDTDLSRADLSGADLSGADLYKANLSGAIITQKQLDQVKSCLYATLPQGLICHQFQ